MKLMFFYIILYTGMACAVDDPTDLSSPSHHLTNFTDTLNKYGNYVRDPNDDGHDDLRPAHQSLLDHQQSPTSISWYVQLLACLFCLDADQLQ